MSRINPVEILRQIKVELQKVKWPSHQQTLKLTLIVIIISLTVGLYISFLDVVFIKLIKQIVNQ